jgi:Domain of unknown function (DUF4337)
MMEAMSTTEELQEQAEHAHAPFDKRVAATMAILAAVLAIVAVFGHLFTTEELLKQQKASDQWSYYQAKSIRRYTSEFARDVFQSQNNAALSQTYAKNIEKYRKDDEEIQKEAQALEKESESKGQQALRLHFGEVFLEIGIVLASLAILTKRAAFWFGSITLGAAGAAVALTMVLIK